MKIIFDRLSSGYIYPLSKKEIIQATNIVSSNDLEKIRIIRFGCNTKTTQEGRTVQHGNFYDIRINFFLKEFTSIILSDDKSYINHLKIFTNGVDQKTRIISWELAEAKRYALFLLFHEIGHVIYSEHHSSMKMTSQTKNEEQWCDRYAMQTVG